MIRSCLILFAITSVATSQSTTLSSIAPTNVITTISSTSADIKTPSSDVIKSSLNSKLTFEQFTADDYHNGYCLLGGDCGTCSAPGGYTTIPCHVPHRPRPLSAESLQNLKEFCPSLFYKASDNAFCCSDDQVEEMIEKTLLAGNFGMENCPSCYHNFKQLVCQMTCSPLQSKRMQVVDHQKPENLSIAETSFETSQILASNRSQFVFHKTREINLFVDEQFAQSVYDSCKNVISSFSNGPLIRLMCDETDCLMRDWLKAIGKTHEKQGYSPMQVNYVLTSGSGYSSLFQMARNEILPKELSDSVLVKPNLSNMTGIIPINVRAYRCDEAISDTLRACECDHCERSCKAVTGMDELKLLTHLSDKRPLSWARQLTVSLGWALFILLIGAFLVYLAILLLKAKRTYSRKLRFYLFALRLLHCSFSLLVSNQFAKHCRTKSRLICVSSVSIVRFALLVSSNQTRKNKFFRF
jgi:hypothetical protein